MIDLNKNVKIALKPFLRWWLRELRFLVPLALQKIVYVPLRTIILKHHDGQLTLEDGNHPQHMTTLPLNDEGIHAFKQLLSEQEALKNAIFVLQLSNKDALCKTLNLPLAARPNIDQMIGYELDRYSPFKPHQVYFTTHIESVDRELEQLCVKLLITPREVLEKRYQDCQALGITLRRIEVEHYPNTSEEHPYNLLPTHLQPKTTHTAQRITTGLLALLITLGMMSLTLPIWLEYQAVQALQNQIAHIEKEVKVVKSLQADMEAMREETQRLIDEKTATPPVVAMLNELSRLLDDKSWLSYLQYSDGQLQMQGESPTASNLLAELEASDYFAKASFASPVTQDKASGMERFQITADVTKPEPVENSDAVSIENASLIKDETLNRSAPQESTDSVTVEDAEGNTTNHPELLIESTPNGANEHGHTQK